MSGEGEGRKASIKRGLEIAAVGAVGGGARLGGGEGVSDREIGEGGNWPERPLIYPDIPWAGCRVGCWGMNGNSRFPIYQGGQRPFFLNPSGLIGI